MLELAAVDGLAARGLALDVLDAVLRRRRPLDEALTEIEGLDALESRDRGFVRVLAAGVLRRLRVCDAVLDLCLSNPAAPLDPRARAVLRLGAVQLLFLATPAHAAVDSSVRLAEQRGIGRLKGLINAVLRKVARDGARMLAGVDPIRLSLPDWLWDAWVATYGEARARAIIAAQLTEPSLDLTVKSDPALWAERLGGTVLPTGTVRLPTGHAITTLPGYDEGAWWVQDAAAALPARLLGPVAGRTVADLCAAPGGKTAQLAAAGASVTAVDRAGRRLARLRENLERLGLAATIVEADTATWDPGQMFDAVLLDAPCSATGTIRRHPDIAWSKTPADVAALAGAQDRLLAAAVRLTRPGGTLVYSVCSLEAAEAEQRLAPLFAAGQVERVPIRAEEIGGLVDLLSEAGDLRATPADLADLGGLDGFFAARLRRLD